MPAILAVILISILFPLPHPIIPVAQPFRAELLLSIFLIALLFRLFRQKAPAAPIAYDQRPEMLVSFAVFAVIAWSAASSAWASAPGWVAHHTLVWGLYLASFIVFSAMIRSGTGFRLITTTFVITSAVLILICVIDYLSISDFASSENGLRVRYGKYAELLITLSPLLWAVALYTRKPGKAAIVFCGAIFSWVVAMLSLSKGAFIAGLVGFAIFFAGSALFAGRPMRKRTLGLAAIWLTVTIGVQVAFSLFSPIPSTSDYITGAADPNRTSTAVRLFTWGIGRQMVSDHLFVGVGADNFGDAFNMARSRFRLTSPDVPQTEIAEDLLIERAHNEPLQILAELGIIGLALVLAPFLIFVYYFVQSHRGKRSGVSPVLWACAGGMTAFAASSLVSSFSFRSAQNGVVFFLVFAIAMREVAKSRGKRTRALPFRPPMSVLAGCLLVCFLLGVYSAAKIVAESEIYEAERTANHDAARAHFRSALTIAPDYAGGWLSTAARASGDGDHALAATATRHAIDNGTGTSLIYSGLAKEQILAGDPDGAEATFREAISIYPRSVFLRTEYIVFLETTGNTDEAAKQTAIARSVDKRQAGGWYAIIKRGSVAAFYEARSDDEITTPAELVPFSAVPQYVDKRPGS